MKLLVLKENLKKGLDIVSRVAAKSFAFPILNNTLISVEGNFLQIAATDLEIGIKYWMLCKAEQEGKVTIPAKFFANVVSSLEGNNVLLETKENNLIIQCDKFNSQIKGLPADDFPIIPHIEGEDFIEVNTVPFCQGLARVVENTALTQTRPEIAGVYLLFQKKQAIMAATDSFRLAEKRLLYEKAIVNPSFKDKTLIIPQKTVRELVSVVSEKAKKLKIYFSPNQVMFEVLGQELSRPELQIVSRLIEGEYPNYQEIIPKEYKTRVVLPRDKLRHHLKTASLFSGRVNEVKIKVDSQKGEIGVSSQSQEIGESRSALTAKVEGENAAVSFNWRFVIDGLSCLESQEVFFGLNGEEGPAALKPIGDPSFVYIVMPIKAT